MIGQAISKTMNLALVILNNLNGRMIKVLRRMCYIYITLYFLTMPVCANLQNCGCNKHE